MEVGIWKFEGRPIEIYYGKPSIIILNFGDQKLNAARSVVSGYRVRVDYNNWRIDDFIIIMGFTVYSLHEVSSNKEHTEKAK